MSRISDAEYRIEDLQRQVTDLQRFRLFSEKLFGMIREAARLETQALQLKLSDNRKQQRKLKLTSKKLPRRLRESRKLNE